MSAVPPTLAVILPPPPISTDEQTECVTVERSRVRTIVEDGRVIGRVVERSREVERRIVKIITVCG